MNFGAMGKKHKIIREEREIEDLPHNNGAFG